MTVFSTVLLASLALNYILYRQSEYYYTQLNVQRLDPLGLNAFPENAPPNTDLPLVVFFGDSRAAGWPVPAASEGFAFANRGIGSQTSVQVLERFEEHISPLGPDVIIVQVGINDLKTIPLVPEDSESIAANCKKNIQGIVEKSLDLGAMVILTTIFPTGDVSVQRSLFWTNNVARSIHEVNTYIRSLAGEKVIVLDAYALLVDADGAVNPEYSYDLLHLNEAGYLRLNEELTPLLEDLKYRRSNATPSFFQRKSTL